MAVKLSSYSVRSSRNSLGHIKNWVIEISDDGNNWEIIGSQSNCREMNHSGAVHNFAVEKSRFSRFCRFRNCGPYWGYSSGDGNATYVEFNALEFFGQIKMPKK